MTATARLFREVLADQALTHSSAAEAREIVARAERMVERYKADIAERASTAPVRQGPNAALEPQKTEQK